MNTASEPLVSIVTPVYNEAEYLAECIESILAQLYQNWDYTIVDNCSTDGSVEVARRYAAKRPTDSNSSECTVLERYSGSQCRFLRQISPGEQVLQGSAQGWSDLSPSCLPFDNDQLLPKGASLSGNCRRLHAGRRARYIYRTLPWPSPVVCGRGDRPAPPSRGAVCNSGHQMPSFIEPT